jgi:putative membrane protein
MLQYRSGWSRRALCALCLTGALSAGCSDDDSTDENGGSDSGVARDAGSDASTRSDGGLDSGVSTMDSGLGTNEAGADASARLSEAQVVGVAAAINSGEIEAGMLAQTKGANAGVRDYAAMMVTMHQAAQQRQNALGVSPASSPVQTTVMTMATSTLQSLQSTPAGAGFDLAYTRSQVTMHTDALNIIDTVLLPSATTTALREELTRTRAEVVAHLSLANTLLLVVGDAGTATSNDAGSDAGSDAGDAGGDAGDAG